MRLTQGLVGRRLLRFATERVYARRTPLDPRTKEEDRRVVAATPKRVRCVPMVREGQIHGRRLLVGNPADRSDYGRLNAWTAVPIGGACVYQLRTPDVLQCYVGSGPHASTASSRRAGARCLISRLMWGPESIFLSHSAYVLQELR